MKNRPSGLSPRCWLAGMCAECWTRKLDTAYTIPGFLVAVHSGAQVLVLPDSGADGPFPG